MITVSHKTCHSIFIHNFEKRWPILNILFTVGLITKFATRFMSYFPRTAPWTCHFITLPCETQKLNNSNRFASKHYHYGSSWIIWNTQNALLWHERTPRDVCATHRLRHHSPMTLLVSNRARPSSGAASVHGCHELDECCTCYHACI